MLGFEFEINGKKIHAALQEGVVTLIATQISKGNVNSIEIDLKGLNTSDLKEDEMINWYNAQLKEGDEFTVKIKNIDSISPPQASEKRLSDIERKMKSYQLLKEELEKKGLI